MKIIYIAGYGRSGSTLVDIILSNRTSTYGLGEISNLTRRSITLDYLPFWNNCITYLRSKFSQYKIKNVSQSDAFSFSKCDYFAYRNFWLELFSYIQKDYPENIDVFVDSSKTTWKTLLRPKRLYKAGFELYIVHLKRSYRNVFKSTLQGSNKIIGNNKIPQKHYLFAIKSMVSQLLTNIFTRLIYSRPKYNYITSNYEEIIEDPAVFIKKIYTFCGIDYSDDYTYIERITSNSYYTGTAFEGNRMRAKNNLIKIRNG